MKKTRRSYIIWTPFLYVKLRSEEKNKMAVFRVEKTKDYTVMSNYHLSDKNLSLKAKGMLSLMFSLPDTWDYTLTGLVYICKDGIASIRTTVAELEAYGYFSHRRVRNEKGQLGDIEYTIHEIPQKRKTNDDTPVENSPSEREKPICGNHTLEKVILDNPTLENHTQINTNQSISRVRESYQHWQIAKRGDRKYAKG